MSELIRNQAAEIGYADLQLKAQLSISSNTIEFVAADELGVSSTNKNEIKFVGDLIQTVDVKTDSYQSEYPDYRVIDLTQNFLTLQHIPTERQKDKAAAQEEKSNSNLIFKLKRVGGEAVLSKVGPQITQNALVNFKGNKTDLTKKFESTQRSRTSNAPRTIEVSCNYESRSSSTKERTLYISAYLREKMPEEENSYRLSESVYIETNGRFNLKLPQENITAQLHRRDENRSPLSVSWSKGEGQNSNFYVSTKKETTCDFNISRNKRMVSYNGVCKNISTYNSGQDEALVMTISGSCVLEF